MKEHEKTGECIYFGDKKNLMLDHILPRSRNGPDSPDNAVWVFKSCNSSKGNRRLYEWYELDRRDEVPRIAEGKYLKLLYALHEQMGTLYIKDIPPLCTKCDLDKMPRKRETHRLLLGGYILQKVSLTIVLHMFISVLLRNSLGKAWKNRLERPWLLGYK